MNIDTKFTPGQTIYVIERDEYAYPTEVSGYMFLAQNDYVAIVTPFIDDIEQLEETLEYLVSQTVENYDCNLPVFPLEDCYATRDDALASLSKEPVRPDNA